MVRHKNLAQSNLHAMVALMVFDGRSSWPMPKPFLEFMLGAIPVGRTMAHKAGTTQ